ncbi:hypothetical protein BaRGS_00033793, partial [Batillaria attramentaria]
KHHETGKRGWNSIRETHGFNLTSSTGVWGLDEGLGGERANRGGETGGGGAYLLTTSRWTSLPCLELPSWAQEIARGGILQALATTPSFQERLKDFIGITNDH